MRFAAALGFALVHPEVPSGAAPVLRTLALAFLTEMPGGFVVRSACAVAIATARLAITGGPAVAASIALAPEAADAHAHARADAERRQAAGAAAEVLVIPSTGLVPGAVVVL